MRRKAGMIWKSVVALVLLASCGGGGGSGTSGDYVLKGTLLAHHPSLTLFTPAQVRMDPLPSM